MLQLAQCRRVRTSNGRRHVRNLTTTTKLMTMADSMESHEKDGMPFSEEPPQNLSADGASRQPASASDHGSDHDSHETAAEAADMVVDNAQETGEDTTAAEEETPQWQPGTTKAGPPASRHLSRTLSPPPGSVAPNRPAEPLTADLDSDILESAGEAADVVRDAAQTGEDSQADHAEDSSTEREAPRDVPNSHSSSRSPKPESGGVRRNSSIG